MMFGARIPAFDGTAKKRVSAPVRCHPRTIRLSGASAPWGFTPWVPSSIAFSACRMIIILKGGITNDPVAGGACAFRTTISAGKHILLVIQRPGPRQSWPSHSPAANEAICSDVRIRQFHPYGLRNFHWRTLRNHLFFYYPQRPGEFSRQLGFSPGRRGGLQVSANGGGGNNHRCHSDMSGTTSQGHRAC